MKRLKRRAGRWTNPSVLLLAGDMDPVAAITERARRLVVKAMDAGWGGPPFDPLQLAEHLRLDTVARADVRDARTVPVTKDSVRIEFNPNRPPARVRYSLAHEIAHTLFPDCAIQVRERSRHEDVSADEWQLEALCNIAAAEILMPFGSLQERLVAGHDMHDLLAVRREYEVSTEALFIHAVRISDTPRAVFCASRLESGPNAGRFRVDYSIGSRTWKNRSFSGLLPQNTILGECAAIGYTTAGMEDWTEPLLIEAVAVPPYPGSRFPRVVGIMNPTDGEDERATELVSLSFVSGSALEPRGSGPRFVIQVVNDKTPNWGGAGFAQALKNAWPEVQRDFRDWVANRPSALCLGNVRIVNLPGGLSVASIIAQHNYGESPRPRIRYSALREGLATVARAALSVGASVHMPRIGTGYGGGSWPVIEDIVRSTLCDAGLLVTVYDLADSEGQARRSEQTLMLL